MCDKRQNSLRGQRVYKDYFAKNYDVRQRTKVVYLIVKSVQRLCKDVRCAIKARDSILCIGTYLGIVF